MFKDSYEKEEWISQQFEQLFEKAESKASKATTFLNLGVPMSRSKVTKVRQRGIEYLEKSKQLQAEVKMLRDKLYSLVSFSDEHIKEFTNDEATSFLKNQYLPN